MYKEWITHKSCGCGGIMTIHMHTLFYHGKTKIKHVPVYTCSICSRYEALPVIKDNLAELIGRLDASFAGQNISFAKHNEWANVLKEAFAACPVNTELDHVEEVIRSAVQGRIDLLLDMYRLAGEMGDAVWMEETEERLAQLTIYPAHR